VLAFERLEGSERVLCVFELGGARASLALKDLVGATPLMLWGDAALSGGGVALGPFGGAILRLAG
jgi:hypothetical protein